jgi:predicted MPP superfamily phosphohydrolase
MMDQKAGKKRLTRRQFIARSAAAATAVGAGTFTYAWRIEPHWIDVVRRDLPIARLPDALLGKTLIQISDIHVGDIVDERYIAAAMERVSALDADILAITGDFMSCDATEQLDPMCRVMRHLKPARMATIGILGNHDYARRWRNPAVADETTRRLTDLGITMLRNARTEVAGLQIAGIDDLWSPNFAPQRVMPAMDSSRAALVLCHNPDAADRPVWAGYQGWILCGHTHGGQCKPPFFSAPVTPVINKRYIAGEVDLFDGRRLYINRGLGYLHRIRFNARPEITVFTLTRG